MVTAVDQALPKGSTVLVTGVNGFLGSHVADQFLQRGYKVRGTVRDSTKESWPATTLSKAYGEGAFELVSVPQMEVEGAFDDVVKGVDAVVHTAASISFDNDASKIVPVTVAGAVNALKAAHGDSRVKRFVLTSSSAAAVSVLDNGVVVTEDRFNHKAVERAWADPPYEPERPLLVYEASKTQAEQAVWKFHRENRNRRPDLIVNTVLPNLIFGPPIDPVAQGYRSSSALIAALWNGNVTPIFQAIPRQYFVDVVDTAVLHVAAALLPHVQDQRIFAFADRFSWDKVLAVMRTLDSERPVPDDFSGGEDPNEIEPRPKAEQLLREMGRFGWTSLADSVAACVKDA